MKTLKEITKLINETSLNDEDSLTEFLDLYAETDKPINFEDLRELINEYIDGKLSVYNYDIIEEWQNNQQAQGSALEALGEYSGDSIINYMAQDLYIYYETLLLEDLDTIEELAK